MMTEIRTNGREMAVPPARWPWLDRIVAAWVIAMILVFLGILAFTVVREMADECRRGDNSVEPRPSGRWRRQCASLGLDLEHRQRPSKAEPRWDKLLELGPLMVERSEK